MAELLLDLQAVDHELRELEQKRSATSPVDLRIMDLHQQRRQIERQIQTTVEGWRRSALADRRGRQAQVPA